MSAEQPKKKSRKNILILGGLVIVGICICGGFLATFFPSEETPTPVAVAGNGQEVEQANTPEPTDVPAPTDTAQPTNTPTPRPTNTPTPTPDPNLVERGTHLVGTDIQPGLYHGFTTGSCYWERLRGLSGTFDDIIANDNASGQFYVSIAENDVAFTVGCAVRLLDPMPEPPDTFPDAIGPGTYLVGIDIQPGLYRGSADAGSCYWERLRNVSGEFNGIIANDNANGQFFIQISPSDFALHTKCSLERTGD